MLRLLKTYAKQLAVVCFWIGAIGGIYFILDSRQLTPTQLIQDAQTYLTSYWYGPLVFQFVATVLRPFTLIPTIILIAAGGAIFGVFWGFVYGMIATTLSAILPYYAGQVFAVEIKQDEQVGLFSRPAQKIARFMRQNAFESLVALRLIQGPYDIVSFVAGNIHMPFRVFILGTFVGNLSAVYVFAALGASVDVEWTSGQLQFDGQLVSSSVMVFIASIVAARYLKVRQARIDDEVEIEEELKTDTHAITPPVNQQTPVSD